MTDINLLPWRDRRRRQYNRQFYLQLLFAAILAMMLLAVVDFWVENKIQQEKYNLDYLNNEQTQFNLKIKKLEQLQKNKEALLTKIQVIQSIDHQQVCYLIEFFKLLNSLPALIPEGTCLSELSRKNRSLTLEGRSATNTAVATLMKQLEKHSEALSFSLVKLTEIKTQKTKSGLQFKIAISLKKDDKDNAGFPVTE